MKFGLKFKQATLLFVALFYSFSLSYGQEACELSVQTPPFAYSVSMPPSSGLGTFDLEINFDGLACHGGSGEMCLCECFLAIYFNPVDPNYLANFPHGFDVVNFELQVNQQTIQNANPPSSLGYYADENVLVVSLGANANVPAGTLLIDFAQDPSSATSVSHIEGICVIDNIDKPSSPSINAVVLNHFGLNDLEPYEEPRNDPE